MDPHPAPAPSLPLSAPPVPCAVVPPPRTCTAGPPAGHGDPGTAEPAHVIATTERGSFCTASCSCGWRGPARRSRDLARRDAAAHLGQPH
ncbi:hypothetical protein [Streptomyces sp. NPDC089919]|uniref:hypothetical protein n=1 Tax=Streptomyces sp. NPDC089919 TaxID=3155188 RepID=UPI0034220467